MEALEGAVDTLESREGERVGRGSVGDGTGWDANARRLGFGHVARARGWE